MNIVSYSIAAVLALSIPATSQEFFPLMHDVKTLGSLPETGTYEILDFRLFMSPDEVDKALRKFSKNDYGIIHYEQEKRGL